MTLEKDIENEFVKYASSKGCMALKFSIPGRRYAPDRIVLCPGGYVFFIEFKRPGQKPAEGQKLYHEKLRNLGFNVYVSDNYDQARAALDSELYFSCNVQTP